jgi:hypothetical protein
MMPLRASRPIAKTGRRTEADRAPGRAGGSMRSRYFTTVVIVAVLFAVLLSVPPNVRLDLLV